MTFDEWKDAVDRALVGAGSALRCAHLDAGALSTMYASGQSPVIASRNIQAAPPWPPVMPAPAAAPAVPVQASPSDPWVRANPNLMRWISVVIMTFATLCALPVLFAFVIVLISPILGRGNAFIVSIAALGFPSVLAGMAGVCGMLGFAQIVLVAAEAVERIRRP